MSFKTSNATSKNLLKNKTQQPKEIAGRAVHDCNPALGRLRREFHRALRQPWATFWVPGPPSLQIKPLLHSTHKVQVPTKMSPGSMGSNCGKEYLHRDTAHTRMWLMARHPRDRQTCKGVLSDRNSRKRSWRLCCVQSEWNSAGKAIKPRVTHKESESRSADLGWRQFSRFSAQG